MRGFRAYLLAVQTAVVSLDGDELLSANGDTGTKGRVGVLKGSDKALEFLRGDL